jgi:hypothetical protein
LALIARSTFSGVIGKLVHPHANRVEHGVGDGGQDGIRAHLARPLAAERASPAPAAPGS